MLTKIICIMEKETDFARHLTFFLSDYLLKERGVSRHTLRSYAYTFDLMLDYMHDVEKLPAERIELKHLTRDSVTGFLDWLQSERKCTDSTRNARLAAIHAFCKYLQYEDVKRIGFWQQIMTIKSKHKASGFISSLSIEAMKALLSEIPADTMQGRRHLAILSLLYESGARVQELIDLTPADLSLEPPAYVTLFGKGRKTRVVPLQERLVTIMRRYLSEHKLDLPGREKNHLFYNNRGAKLSNSGIAHIITLYANDVRVKHPGILPDKISPHSFRHSKAMHLLQAGLNLIYIRDILGHASIKTTEIYARADSKQKRDALEKAYAEITPERPEKGEWETKPHLKTWLKQFTRK